MLTVSSGVQARLSAAANEGLDVNYVVWVDFPDPVGRRYYSRRPVTIGGQVYEPKLIDAPRVAKRADLGSLSGLPLDEAVEIRIRNTYEREDGTADPARFQDLMDEAPIYGCLVHVGFVEQRTGHGGPATEIKWDHLYRVERPIRTSTEVVLRCTDALLLPGERPVGRPVTDADWPYAPTESYGQIRGPVFGRVEGLPLIPVEVGFEAALDVGVDEQDTVLSLVPGVDLTYWPSQGWAEIGDEIVWYGGLDKGGRRLTGVARGAGFPRTAAGVHGSGAVVREVYTGREGVLLSSVAAGANSLPVSNAAEFPNSGVVVVEGEAIRYSGKNGGWLVNLQRGQAIPTLARPHEAGSVVRTIPIGGDGNPRYRYLVAQGTASISSVLVLDEEGRPAGKMPTPVVSQTVRGGVVWTVADFGQRPRVTRYSSSVSQVPVEWTAELVDEGDVSKGFRRWKAGPECSSGLVGEIGKALDPRESTQAILLAANNAAKGVLDLTFNAGWDNNALNDPLRRFGRFKDARLIAKVQYSRRSNTRASFWVKKDNVVWKTGTIKPPADTTGVAGRATVSATVPASAFAIDRERKVLRLQRIVSGPQSVGRSWHWVSGRPSANVTTASMPSFVLGTEYLDWSGGSVISEQDFTWSWSNPDNVTADPFDPPPLVLATDDLGHADNRGHVTGVWLRAQVYPGTTYPIPGVRVVFFGRENRQQVVWEVPPTNMVSDAGGKVAMPLPLPSWWVMLQHFRSVQVEVRPPARPWGAALPVVCGVRCVWLEVEYEPAISGRYGDVQVATGFFNDPSAPPENPSDAYEQRISLGQAVREWVNEGKRLSPPVVRNPWEFFTSPALNNLGAQASSRGGFQFVLAMPQTGEALQLAVADVRLELEYEAPEVWSDGQLVADVNGRTGTPVGGGGSVVLEHPVDLLAYLVDQSEFLGMAAQRDAASFAAAKSAMGDAFRLARAVMEELTVRELIAELCSESRLLLLFDQGKIQARFREAKFSTDQAVVNVGDVAADQALRLLNRGEVVREPRLEEYANQIALYYRENLLTGEPRASQTFNDSRGQASALGVRRTTKRLKWHQSARGYGGDLAKHRDAVARLGGFYLDSVATIWEYATLELWAAVAERLQRMDVITISRPQSGLYFTPARVVGTERTSSAGVWRVVVQMAPMSASVYWTALNGLGEETETRLRFAAGGGRLDWYWQGRRVVSLTADGDLLVAGAVRSVAVYELPVTGMSGAGTPAHENIDHGVSELRFCRKLYAPGVFQGRFEKVLAWDNSYQRLEVCPCRDEGTGSVVQRTIVTGQNLGGQLGVPNGVYDTGSGTTNGVLRFVVGGRSVMEITNTQVRIRGGIRYTVL